MSASSVTDFYSRERRSSARWTGNARINVGPSERFLSLASGGLMALYGLSQGTTKGLLLAGVGAALAYRGATGHCDCYQALGLSTARRRPHTAIPSGQGVKIEESTIIMRPARELYEFWRNFSNLPRVMRHLVSVQEDAAGRSHWVARGPVGEVEWHAEIIADRPSELISWRSMPDSTVATAGSVRFQEEPHNRGTIVEVVLSYNPPAGRVAAALAWLASSDPKTEIHEDLQNFKRLMETQPQPAPPSRIANSG